MGMKKEFPVDIWTLKRGDVEQWHQEFNGWPVTPQELKELVDAVNMLFARTILDAPRLLGDVLQTPILLMADYAMLMHATLVTERLRQSGWRPLCDGATLYYPGLLGEGPVRGIYNYKPDHFPAVPTWPARPRGWLRTQKRAYEFRQKQSDSAVKGQSGPPFLALGDPGPTLTEYARTRQRQIRFLYPFDLLNRSAPSIVSEAEVSKVVDSLIMGLHALAVDYNFQLGASHTDYLVRTTRDAISAAARAIEAVWPTLRNRSRTSFLARPLANVLVRSVTVVARHTGHRVIGAPHGSTTGVSKVSSLVPIELAVSDTYLAFNRHGADLLSRTRDAHPLGGRWKTDIEVLSSATKKFKQWGEAHQADSLPDRIKRVMLIEFPLNSMVYENVLGHWPYHLDLIISVSRLLRKYKMETILKLHPDRLQESDGVFGSFFDEQLVEPYEQVYQQADAYLFTNIATSTFGFALTTNRPIIIFDIALQDVYDVAHDALRKRCRVIPSWFDEQGRLQFDEDALARALTRKPELPDMSFVETYMFPDSGNEARIGLG
jgi:hypothetical protein